MNAIVAIVSREVRSAFLSPVGYIVAALLAAITALVFIAQVFDQGKPASMRPVFEWGTWMLLFICPAISMRAIAEERRMGTYEMLFSCPVSERQVIAGKFIGSLLFLAAVLLPTLVQALALERYGRPDYGEIACGYLGLMLAGSAYLATGLFMSALTTSQIVAFLGTLFFWLGLTLGAKLLPAYLPPQWADLAFFADPDPRLRDFAIGLIDTSNIVYFASVSLLFLMAATRALQAGRWR